MFDPQIKQTPKPVNDDREVDLDEWDNIVADRYKVPRSLMKAIATQESGGNTRAKSPTGVVGKYQVTERTAKGYGLDRNDPWQQSVAAAKHLRTLYDSTPGDDDDTRWLGSAAKYYGGDNAVKGDEVSTGSLDGLSNPSRYVEGIAKKWGELRRQERGGQTAAQQPGIPSTIAVGHSQTPQTARPVRPQPAQPRQPLARNVFNKNLEQDQRAANLDARKQLDFRQYEGNTGQVMAQTEQINRRVPVDPKLRKASEQYQQMTMPAKLATRALAAYGGADQEAVNRVTQPAPYSLEQAVNKGVNTGVRMAGNMARGVGELAVNVTYPNATGAQASRAVRPVSQAATRVADVTAPTNPQDQSWMTDKIPGAAGSVVPFALGSMMTGGTSAAPAVMGGLASMGQFSEEVDQSGKQISETRRGLGNALAIATGMTEALGIGRALNKMGVAKPVIERAAQILEESGQEYAQKYLEDINAKLVGGYDPNRSLSPTDPAKLEAAALGGIVGGGMAAPSLPGDIRAQRGTARVAAERPGPMGLTPTAMGPTARASIVQQPQGRTEPLTAPMTPPQVERTQPIAPTPDAPVASAEGAPDRATYDPGPMGDMEYKKDLADFNRQAARAAKKAPAAAKPQFDPVKQRQQVVNAQMAAQEAEQAGNFSTAARKYKQALDILGQMRGAAKTQANEKLWSDLNDEMNAARDNMTAARKGQSAPRLGQQQPIQRPVSAEVQQNQQVNTGPRIGAESAPTRALSAPLPTTGEAAPLFRPDAAVNPEGGIPEVAKPSETAELQRRIDQEAAERAKPTRGRKDTEDLTLIGALKRANPEGYRDVQRGEAQGLSAKEEGMVGLTNQNSRTPIEQAAHVLDGLGLRLPDGRPFVEDGQIVAKVDEIRDYINQNGRNRVGDSSGANQDQALNDYYENRTPTAELPRRTAELPREAPGTKSAELVPAPDVKDSLTTQEPFRPDTADLQAKRDFLRREPEEPQYTEAPTTGRLRQPETFENPWRQTPEAIKTAQGIAAQRQREQLPPVERRRTMREAVPKGQFGKLSEASRAGARENQSLVGNAQLRRLLGLSEMPAYREADAAINPNTGEPYVNPAWNEAAQETLNALAAIAGKERSSQINFGAGKRSGGQQPQRRGQAPYEIQPEGKPTRGEYGDLIRSLQRVARQKGERLTPELEAALKGTAEKARKAQSNYQEFIVDERVDNIRNSLDEIYRNGQLSRDENTAHRDAFREIANEYGLSGNQADQLFAGTKAEAAARAKRPRSSGEAEASASADRGGSGRVVQPVEQRATGTEGGGRAAVSEVKPAASKADAAKDATGVEKDRGGAKDISAQAQTVIDRINNLSESDIQGYVTKYPNRFSGISALSDVTDPAYAKLKEKYRGESKWIKDDLRGASGGILVFDSPTEAARHILREEAQATAFKAENAATEKASAAERKRAMEGVDVDRLLAQSGIDSESQAYLKRQLNDGKIQIGDIPEAIQWRGGKVDLKAASGPRPATEAKAPDVAKDTGGNRAKTINDIVDAARKPLPNIIERPELEGYDGNWYSPRGIPANVRLTGKKRVAGYAFADKNGIAYGQRAATKEELIARHNEGQERDAAELRAEMEKKSDADLQSSADYWLGEQQRKTNAAKEGAAIGARESAKAKPAVAESLKPEVGDEVRWMAGGREAVADVIRTDEKAGTVGVEYFGYKIVPISELTTVKKSERNVKRAERQAKEEADATAYKAKSDAEQVERQKDWRTSDYRTKEFDAIVQREYANAERTRKKAGAEQTKIKPIPSTGDFTATGKAEYAKQQAKIDKANATRKEAEAYARKPQKPTAEQPKATTGSAENDATLARYRAKGGRGMTAGQEAAMKLYEAQEKADPAKWKTGQGVGRRVYAGGKAAQTNRGFQIVEINPDTKEALIKSVKDTGLTSSGGNYDRIAPEWVHIADLVRDKKFDGKAKRSSFGPLPNEPKGPLAGSDIGGVAQTLLDKRRAAKEDKLRTKLTDAQTKYDDLDSQVKKVYEQQGDAKTEAEEARLDRLAQRLEGQRAKAKDALTQAKYDARDLPPMAKTAPKADFDTLAKAMVKEEPRAATGALVSIADLRKQMKDQFPTKEGFDKFLLSQIESGKVIPARHDYPASLSETDKRQMVADGKGNYYLGASLADDYSPRSAKAKAPDFDTLAESMGKTDSKAYTGALVSLTELRAQMKDQFPAKADFDKFILDQAEKSEGDVTLHRHVFPQSQTKAQLDGMVTDGENYYVGVGLRNDYTPKVKAPTAKAAPKAKAPDFDALAQKMIEQKSDARSGALVSISDLREQMRNQFPTKEGFDKFILSQAETGKVALHHHDYVSSLTDAERNALVADDRGNHYIGIALREPYSPRSNPVKDFIRDEGGSADIWLGLDKLLAKLSAKPKDTPKTPVGFDVPKYIDNVVGQVRSRRRGSAVRPPRVPLDAQGMQELRDAVTRLDAAQTAGDREAMFQAKAQIDNVMMTAKRMARRGDPLAKVRPELTESTRWAEDKYRDGKITEAHRDSVLQATEGLRNAAKLGSVDAIQQARRDLRDAKRDIANKGMAGRAGYKALNVGSQVARGVQTATFGSDWSYIFRQGGPIALNPLNVFNTAKAFQMAYHAQGSETGKPQGKLGVFSRPFVGAKGAEWVRNQLENHPMFKDALRADLKLSLSTGAEEIYKDSVVSKAPWIKRTEAANEAALDFLRLQEFGRYKKAIDARAGQTFVERQKAMEQAAEIVNTLTGRTDLGDGGVKKVVEALNGFLSAPRLNVSRIKVLDPTRIYREIRKNPAVGGRMAKDAMATVATWGGAMALGNMAGFWSANVDPDDPDFGKIRVGDTRYDVAFGLLPLLRLYFKTARYGYEASQDAVQQTPDSEKERKAAGEKAGWAAKTFVRGRLGPLYGYANDLWWGSNLIGEPVNLRQVPTLDKNSPVRRLAIPITYGEMGEMAAEGYKREGKIGALKGAAKGMPAMIGFGVSDYQKKKKGVSRPFIPPKPVVAK